jgi:murein DD-endopeptidase MepM/ murein hydrolase activator NlpD
VATAIKQTGNPLPLPAEIDQDQDDIILRAAVPHTIIPDRKKAEILTYVVQAGDTVFGIAAKFGLQPGTILWANSSASDNPDWLQVDQELLILPVDGVYHQVVPGDTVDSIAAAYKVGPEVILTYPFNELSADESTLETGKWVVVPGGSKPYVPRTVTAYSGPVPEDATVGSGIFGWPASGTISQGYWHGHYALDVAAWTGAPIVAADSGYVVAAGWDDTGYGNLVVIDHGNGFQTLYSHLEISYVAVGDEVAKGEQIGEMGCTGNCTGPHLHFEVRQGTIQRNPIGFLP